MHALLTVEWKHFVFTVVVTESMQLDTVKLYALQSALGSLLAVNVSIFTVGYMSRYVWGGI